MTEPDLSGAAVSMLSLIEEASTVSEYDRVRLAVAVIEGVCSRSQAPTAVRYMAIQRLKSVELEGVGLTGEGES